MNPFSLIQLVSADCSTKDSGGNAAVGLVILLVIVGPIVALAIANSRARRNLAMANAELNFLRPECARLRQWRDTTAATAGNADPSSGYGTGSPMPAQWYPDPSRRHELR